MLRQPILQFIILASLCRIVSSIRCYECVGGQDNLCGRYIGTTCEYGFFGCIKIATFSGGVDKLGNFLDDYRSVISMVRGCNILPVGGVDACQQQVLLGYRIVSCYCFSDYCNAATSSQYALSIIKHSAVLIILVVFSRFLLLHG